MLGQQNENRARGGWSSLNVPMTGALEVGLGEGGCKDDDKNKCLRRGSQLNSKVHNTRFKGRKKMGNVGNTSRLRVAIKHKRDQENGKKVESRLHRGEQPLAREAACCLHRPCVPGEAAFT